MQTSLRAIVLSAACCLAGCAAERKTRPPAPAATAPSVALAPEAPPAPRGNAFLTLDELPNRPDLAAIAPPVTSQPSATRPPIDAVNLYASAMHAFQTGRRATAINELERAIELDPNSFALNYALGRVQETGRSHDEESIRAFERAAAINPDHLELQTTLGR